MVALAAGVVAMGLVLLGALGIRLVRTDIVDELGLGEAQVVGERRLPIFLQIVDGLGLRFQRVLVRFYGARRLGALERRLRAAGYPEGLTRSVFIQREAGFVVLGLVIVLLSAVGGHVLVGLLLGLVFMVWMQVWLVSAAQRRTTEIDRDLPDFLDVLAVTVRAGMPFRTALERVSDFHGGPLAEEMSTALQSMKLGVSRRDAFLAVRDNSRSENVAIFVTALLQAEELGTPLADALGDISAEIRRQRAQQVRREAAKAQPKVSFVVTTTIMPAALLLMMVGMVMANSDAFGLGG